MLLTIPGILNADALAQVHRQVMVVDWADGRATSGHQSALVKHNHQLPEDAPATAPLRTLILQALGRNPAFTSAALPLRVFPPRFNRHAVGMTFGDHIDNTILDHPGGLLRADMSATIFLTAPDAYDGGELVIEDTFGSRTVKLAAGDMILYPSGSIHRVQPVTRGERLACFFWVQSMIRDDGQRTMLHDLDLALRGLRQRGLSGEQEMVMLTGVYHNLLRRWAEL